MNTIGSLALLFLPLLPFQQDPKESSLNGTWKVVSAEVLWVQSIEKDQDSTWRFEAGKVFVKHSTTKETELGFYSLRKSIAIEEPKQIDIELKEAVNGKNL